MFSPQSLLLHGHFQSGNVYKVARMLTCSRAPYEGRHLDVFNGEARSPEFQASVNRFREVPALRYGEETVVQSSVTLSVLSEPLGTFSGDTGSQRRRIAEWLVAMAQRAEWLELLADLPGWKHPDALLPPG